MPTTKAKSCTGKHRHTSRVQALGHIRSLMHERGVSACTYRAYRCRHCQGWHVGHAKRGR